jgi:hypothetical protein
VNKDAKLLLERRLLRVLKLELLLLAAVPMTRGTTVRVAVPVVTVPVAVTMTTP